MTLADDARAGGGAQRGGAAVALSVMMFLQYAVWGMWFVQLPNYLGAARTEGGLGFTGGQIGWILGLAGSIGAIAAPFIAGQIADRYLNAERALALLLGVGGVIKFATAATTQYAPFLVLSILYSIVYMPTLSLTNSISFQHLPDKEKQFPWVRLWGTIGWIVGSGLFPLLWLGSGSKAIDTARLADAMRAAGALSILYGMFCLLALPKTPPRRDIEHPLAFAKAFGLLRHRGFLVLTLVAVPIAMIHSAYFIRIAPFVESAGLPLKWIGPALTIGQWSEIVFLALLGYLLSGLGYRGVLILGCLAYVGRFAIFASTTSPQLIIAAQALHGLCYGCFFAGSYIYVERVAPADIRHSAQTVFGIMILGLGPVLAGFYNQYFDRFGAAELYRMFWWTEAFIALAMIVVLAALFPGATPASDVQRGLEAVVSREGE